MTLSGLVPARMRTITGRCRCNGQLRRIHVDTIDPALRAKYPEVRPKVGGGSGVSRCKLACVIAGSRQPGPRSALSLRPR